MAQQAGLLMSLSSEMANVVETVAPSLVRVDDGTRLTATGIIWDAAGVIVTTSHGVERDDELAVVTADGARHAATLVGRDPDTDIAVLKVAADGLPAIARANSDEAKVGHLVLALGRPGDAGLQATVGIISARMESQSGGIAEYVLHTDAVFYPGFSGGALVNMRGELVGLNNLMFGRGRGQGVALGVPIVKQAASSLLAHGRIRRGYLGIRTQAVELPAYLIKSLDLKQTHGLLIVQADAAGPAETSGLTLGDTLLAIGTISVEDVDTLRGHLRSIEAGKAVETTILRGGVIQKITVTLGAEENRR